MRFALVYVVAATTGCLVPIGRSSALLVVPSHGLDVDAGNWLCTVSNRAAVGGCFPNRPDCEALRNRLLAIDGSMSACWHTVSVDCYGDGASQRCMPDNDTCEAQRTVVLDNAPTGDGLLECHAEE